MDLSQIYVVFENMEMFLSIMFTGILDKRLAGLPCRKGY